ncbi:MAG: tetratricopeptide repeat protein [Bacteroidia bacterium]|nr:tetratricopeptide repeat protein [Bacteroidia bacterium]
MSNKKVKSSISGTAKSSRKVRNPDSKITGNSSESLKPSKKHLHWLYLAAILILTVVLYSGSLSGNLLNWDDNTYILENSAIHKLDFQHISEIFSGFYAFNYHPLTTLSWALEYSAVGDKSPILYHLDNLILHLINIILVFWVFRLITKKNSIALIVALFHAIHPAHVESVAWISERKDLLYSLFYLLSAGTYLLFLRNGNFLNEPKNAVIRSGNKLWKYFAASLIFFLLSLLSKSAAVILPVTLLLLDFLLHRRLSARMFLEKLPFFVLAFIFGIITLRSQEKAINDVMHYSGLQSIMIVNTTVLRYLLMVILPTGLSALYPWPEMAGNSLPSVYYAGPVITLVIIAAVLFSIRKSRDVAFAALFFLANLLLVLQLIPVGEAVMADRYTYIAFLGVFYLLAVWLVKIYEYGNGRSALTGKIAIVVVLVLTAGFTYAAETRIKVWKTDTNLWDDMIIHYPSSAYKAYLNRSRYRQESHDTKGAYEDLTRLINAKKYYPEALAMRGLIISDSGDYTGAMRDFNEAVRSDPGYYLAYNNRGATRMKTNDLKGALDDFNKSIQCKNDYYLAWFNRGAANINLKKYEKAVKDFEQAMKLKPGYCEAMFACGAAYSDSGLVQSAIASYNEAIRCNPRYEDAYVNLGSLKMKNNDDAGAMDDLSKAIVINPKSFHAYYNIARLKMKNKDYQTAIENLNKCTGLNGSFAMAYAALGTCSYNSGNKSDACRQWLKGAQLGDEECKMDIRAYCR